MRASGKSFQPNLILTALTLVVLSPRDANAFLDTIAQAAKDAAKAAVYADAVAEVANQLGDKSEVANGARALDQKIAGHNLQLNDSYYLSNDLRGALSDRDWSKQSLDQNIQFMAAFIGQMKRFLVSLGLVGTDAGKFSELSPHLRRS